MHLFFTLPGGWLKRILTLVASGIVFAIPVVLVSLPFFTYSNDYWYMVVQYVTQVPLQTQSWLVALALAFGADNRVLQVSSALSLLAACAISLFAVRRKTDLWLAALLIVLSFFLLSKKVVGYYYVMVLPFALVTLIPARRFRLLAVITFAIAFISVSPYFAGWGDPANGWVYGLLGVTYSMFWFGVFIWLWRNHPLAVQFAQNPRTPAYLSVGLLLVAVFAALLQPLVASGTSPIRAPLIAPGTETSVAVVALGMLWLTVTGLVLAALYTRTVAREYPISRLATAAVILLAPLYFLTFALTKESTAALEVLLK